MNTQNIMEYSNKGSMAESLIVSDKRFQDFYRLPLMESINEKHAMLLFSCLTSETFEVGKTIYSAGEASAGKMHIILDGKVVVHSASGYKYNSLRKGEVFGLFSFLDEQRTHSATLTVERHTHVLTLERTFFDLMTLEEPKLASQWMRFMFSLLSKKALELEIEYANIHNFAFGGKV